MNDKGNRNSAFIRLYRDLDVHMHMPQFRQENTHFSIAIAYEIFSSVFSQYKIIKSFHVRYICPRGMNILKIYFLCLVSFFFFGGGGLKENSF